MELIVDALPDLLATLVGVAIGGLGALFVNRRSELFQKRKRKQIVLRNISQELVDSYNAMQAALPVYEAEQGVSFYISTIAWETAVASGDLPDIIGFELADSVENQYSMYFHLRYYLAEYSATLHSSAPSDQIAVLRSIYREAIIKGLNAASQHHPQVIAQIEAARD